MFDCGENSKSDATQGMEAQATNPIELHPSGGAIRKVRSNVQQVGGSPDTVNMENMRQLRLSEDLGSAPSTSEPPQSDGFAGRQRIPREIPSVRSWRYRDEQGEPAPITAPSSSRMDRMSSPPRFVRKMSTKELLHILNMDSVDAFLEILDNTPRFIDTVLEEGKSHEIVVILINILGKIHEVPLKYHLQDFVRQIFGENVTFRNDILSYVKYAVDLEAKNRRNLLPHADQMWEYLEIFCRYAKNIEGTTNCWAYFIRAICRILNGQTQQSLLEKHSIFTKLYEEVTSNYFYQGEIHATVQDAKEKHEIHMPQIKNGKFSNAEEYLDFLVSYSKYHYLPALFNAIEAFNEMEEEQKNAVVLKDIKGTNIFPCVQMNKPLNRSIKYFLLDLAPHKRIETELPESVMEEIDETAHLFENSDLIFLSTSSDFSDLIVASSFSFPDDLNKDGFLMIKINRMENIHENFLNRDLFMVTINEIFTAKIFALRILKDISTAQIAMKEFLINCESSATIPYYKNLESDDFSLLILDRINLRMRNYNDEELQHLGMNSKQFEAFQLAQTRKLTVIQGPPGVGKSMVIANVIQRLIANTSLKILLIAYRNKALDNLVMKCSQFTDQIVRVGYYSYDKDNVMRFMLNREVQDPRYLRINQNTSAEYAAALRQFVDISQSESGEIEMEFHKMNEKSLKLQDLYILRYYSSCKDARIMAMTSTGTGKYNLLLQLFRPSIVIMDEAVIYPETHLISSLNDHVQQLIMIGDSKQVSLLPDSNYLHCPNTILFERMVENDINTINLNVQYRMHPDIAELVRHVFYSDLIDGENVKDFQPIRGIGKNLFCVTQNFDDVTYETLEALHEEFSFMKNEFRSKENIMTVLFAMNLAIFLRQQGYASDEIKILTASEEYEDALGSIKEFFPLLDGVNVHSIYAFHGSECRLEVLCLLRSEIEGEVEPGNDYYFNSLLTRAQEGLFIVENISSVMDENDTWNKIRDKLGAMGAIGPCLPVKCEKHECEMMVRSVEDFQKFTREGCPVGRELPDTTHHPCLEDV